MNHTQTMTPVLSHTHTLGDYESVAGVEAVNQLRQIGERLAGLKLLHINSTKEGGGVAEILNWMIPTMREVGVDATWDVITGPPRFYEITKSFHNGLQGQPVDLSDEDWALYREVNANWAEAHRDQIAEADIILVHDPQPAAIIEYCRGVKAKWIWRAHIDISRPQRNAWKGLQSVVGKYNASIFSLNAFAQALPHPQYLVPPCIDPLSIKNRSLTPPELRRVARQFNIDPTRPLLVQVSRFDRFKDPLGVIKAFRLVQRVRPVQLVLVGGGATDDPEGAKVYEEVLEAAGNDPDIHVQLLPPDAHHTINALQRLADIIIQKSTKEGFGLTVTEGLWKGKPVIGGDTGGIRLQVIDYHTGFLVSTPEGAAHRIRFLLDHPRRLDHMGRRAREFVRDNFLLTRQVREYLTLVFATLRDSTARVVYV